MPIRFPVSLLALALVASLLAIDTNLANAIVTPDQQTAMLAAHNKLRREVATAETQRLGRTVTIPDLTWNAAAAVSAQAWADQLAANGKLDHNPAIALGEAIAAFESSVPFPNPNPTSVESGFALWKGEAPDYNWDTNSCASACGHYTQVIWAGSTSVGCGVATGPGALLPGGYRTVWVCHYAPAGNIAGARPYEPGPAVPAPTPPAAASPTATPGPGAAAGEGGFVGTAPARGLVGLLVTSTTSSATGLVTALTAGGCAPASLAVLQAGAWKVYVVGAPAVVNSAFPASLPSGTPFFVRCAP